MFTEESYFERMSHEVSNPYLWVIIFLLALRGVYSNTKKQDYGHAAAFGFVLIVSGFFAGIGLGILSPDTMNSLFN
ncbi:MAG: hypothetical protein IJW91_03690 [Phascolarctobacterium sp.]|nr:hypothetical protein [Phascolarctobacterium sp.]MBQ7759781.1 hypothetical protein [Acidaminococcaceae bacterium]